MVAVDFGGWSRNVLVVKPGKSWRKFIETAFWRVVSAGENSAACAKATSSGILFVELTLLAW